MSTQNYYQMRNVHMCNICIMIVFSGEFNSMDSDWWNRDTAGLTGLYTVAVVPNMFHPLWLPEIELMWMDSFFTPHENEGLVESSLFHRNQETMNLCSLSKRERDFLLQLNFPLFVLVWNRKWQYSENAHLCTDEIKTVFSRIRWRPIISVKTFLECCKLPI